MPPNRDWLDILVATFTVSTGVVIALAALLAFVVQRARYLREIEPDLRLGEAPVFTLLSTEEGLTFGVSWRIDNTSANPARGLVASWDFEIVEWAVPTFPVNLQVVLPEYEKFLSIPDVQLRYPNLLSGRANNLLAAFSIDIHGPRITQIFGSENAVNVEDVSVRVRVSVGYSNVRDFTSFLFMPWRRGSAVYSRSAEIEIRFKDAGVGQIPRYLIEPLTVQVQ